MRFSLIGQAGKSLCRRAFHCSAFASSLQDAFGAVTIALAFLCLFTGCSKKQPVLDAQKGAALQKIHEEESSFVNVKDPSTGKIMDFDLTKMNPNMVYATVFNLMLEPESYDGKIFRMKGNFLKVNGPDGQYAYAVIVKDALACCQQGLEFKYDFAGKEPAAEQIIEVTGAYTVTELEDGIMHNYVLADLVELQ